MKSRNQKSIQKLFITLPDTKVKAAAARKIKGGANEYPWQ